MSLVFLAGILVGYVLTMGSLFPTVDGNSIFAKAPANMPRGNDSPAVSAHLALVHDMSLLRKQSWCYELIVCDAQGTKIGGAEFSPKQVGGQFNLISHGELEWDEDAWAVTVSINDFNHRCEIPKNGS